MRCRLVVAIACVVSAALPARIHAQPQQTPSPYTFEWSSVPMTRNAALVDGTLRLVERGTDWVSDRLSGNLFVRRSPTGFFARAARWALFDFFVQGYGPIVTHEYGHVARVEETGRTAQVFIRSPLNSFFTARGGGPFTAFERMSVFSGGLEGQLVLRERIGDRIYAAGTASPGDLTSLLLNAILAEGYLLGTLSEDRLSSPERLLRRTPTGALGDPVQYSIGVAAARESRVLFTNADLPEFFQTVQSTGRAIRGRSLLNLLDYEYVTTAGGLFRNYMWQGERHVPVKWINLGRISLVPGVTYRLSPVGPETQIRTRYKVRAGVGRIYGRWTESVTPGEARLSGGGGDFERLTSSRLVPTFTFDIWRNPDRTMSGRAELGATFSRSPRDRFVAIGAIGVKGRGYLFGQPLSAGPYVGVGGGFRF